MSSAVIEKSKGGVGRLVKLYDPRTWREKGILWSAGLAVVTYAVVVGVLWFIWDTEPDTFDVRQAAVERAGGDESALVPGYVTTATVIETAEVMLGKPGGYLSNDLTPPGLLMDNIPNWEFGVLTELRDATRALRNDFGRSQTQSVEDKDLQVADPQFSFDSESWMLPATESEYRKGITALESYLRRLSDPRVQGAQFYARADNLRDYFAVVEKRLGSLSQRLSASVGQLRVNVDLAGDTRAHQSTPTPEDQVVSTPWLEIDDIFYEARGYTWALLHMLRAIEVDFGDVLQGKNAVVSLRQIIRELEQAQEAVWSPMILNGTGFGMLANHSLIMTSYISRANAAVLDLRTVLFQG